MTNENLRLISNKDTILKKSIIVIFEYKILRKISLFNSFENVCNKERLNLVKALEVSLNIFVIGPNYFLIFL